MNLNRPAIRALVVKDWQLFEKQLAAGKMTEASLKAQMKNDDDTKVNKLIEATIVATVV